VVRSRDPEVLKGLDAVIDVGGVYDPASRRFDHHQKGFEEVFGHGFTTKLSSAGLVYKHFGREVVAARLGLAEGDKDLDDIYLRVYKSFVEAVDAIDNGVNQYDSDVPARYQINTGLASRVGRLNPQWNEGADNAELDRRFARASEMAGKEFLDEVDFWGKCWLPARAVVKAAMDARASVHASGAVLHLAQPCPWKDHLYEIEAEEGCEGAVKFVLYLDDREGKYRVQAVNLPGSFELRRGLKAEWRGLRGEQLDAASGIPGGVFVHAGGFIGGHDTLEGALAMAAQSL